MNGGLIGRRVWRINEDGTYSPASFVRHSLVGLSVLRMDTGELVVWPNRNLIDDETAGRFSVVVRKSLGYSSAEAYERATAGQAKAVDELTPALSCATMTP